MELMLLVYAVENLSYNGSFFASLATWIFYAFLIALLIKTVIHFYNEHNKEVRTVLKTKVKLSSGDVFNLEKDVYTFEAGKNYKVESVFSHSDTVFFKECDSEYDYLKSCEGRKHIEKLLSEQKGEQVKTTEAKHISLPKLPIKLLLILSIVFVILHALLPQRQTAIYMVGAYAAQEILTADKTKELGNKTYLVVSNQLDKWAEEVPELKTLISDQVEKVVKDKIVEEVK